MVIGTFAFLALVQFFFKVRQILKAFKQAKTMQQHNLYGTGTGLTNYSEVSVWFDPGHLTMLFPKLKANEIKVLCSLLTKFAAHCYQPLFVRSRNITVIRVPYGAVVSFGTDCWDCKDNVFYVSDFDQVLSGKKLNKWRLSSNAVYILTIKHID